MTRRARLALVGLGTWAATGHLPVYAGRRLREHVEVVALCSRDHEKARAWADEHDIAEAYDDFDRLLEDAQPDIVSVCTPDHAHTDFVLRALETGCHVLVEKPLATSLEEARSIIGTAKRTGRRVVTQFHKRADPLWAEAADRVAAGSLGALQMGTVLIENPLTVPAGDYFTSDLSAHTDPNWFLGSHMYDLLRFITGLDPRAVRAHRYEGTLIDKGVGTTDAFKADIQLEGGASVTVMSAWNLPTGAPSLTKQSMLLHFENGELDLDGARRGFTDHGGEGYRYVNPHFLRDTPHGPAGYGATLLEDSVLELAGVDMSRTSLPGLDDAWWATAVAEAVNQAATSGTEVEVVGPPS